ncbi:MAG: sulfite exporter TauE/SafE family protein [Aliidongia sp.]
MNLLYSLAGLGVGLLVGMTGVGGGSLMTPVLVLLFGFHPATAVGTDLLFAAVTKTVGSGVHGFSGTVNWRVTGLLAIGSIPATVITVSLIARIGAASPQMAQIISLVLGAALVVTALAVILRNRIQAFALARLARSNRGARRS